mmetsp:Transcript_10299/g.20060  ORF Transcript_10299/g.20060 Transcript_10299/m.20060 type:complete len:323 (+) Transcript_10299:283-1251(+)
MDRPICLDIAPFIDYFNSHSPASELPAELSDMCRQLMESFHHTGIVFVRDPRVNEQDNQDFIDVMQRFYTELAAKAESEPDGKPLSEGRILWCVKSDGDPVDFPNWFPENIPEFKERLDKWGATLLSSLKTVTLMVERGLGIEPGTISSRFANANHMLNPSGFDLNLRGPGSVLTTIHYDMSFITVHGNSRFPVFTVWLRDGRTVDVEIPEGLLMFQAGMIFEYMTGGYALAGHHIVTHSEKTAEVVERARADGKSLWKINSSMFGNIQQDQTIELIPGLEHLYSASVADTRAKYPTLSLNGFTRRESKALTKMQAAYDSSR